MNVVVTGGGTIAPIDDVRHVANASTGRFSAEISEACLLRGATVWHVHARSALLPFHRDACVSLDARDPDAEAARLGTLRTVYRSVRDRLHLRPLEVGTVHDYARTLRAVFREVPIDLAFLAMAASDYEPWPHPGKIRSDREALHLVLQPSPKVIRSVRDWSPDVFLVGFKLLSNSDPGELIALAREACVINRADLTVANDLGPLLAGRHTVHLVRSGRDVETLGPGGSIADELVERAMTWAGERHREEAPR
jgi:phosphopantothenate-cysteine ligase